MAMNSKDTIIVFANVWATYIFLRYLQKQNISNNRNRYILLAGLTVGFGTGVKLPFIATLFPLIILICWVDGDHCTVRTKKSDGGF